MARKYGKKKHVKVDPLKYNHGLAGISGIGKTTMAIEYCELFGDDIYMHYNIGYEDGADAIEGIVSEDIETWQDMIDIKEDIIANRNTDYKDLKIIIYDTIDQLIPLAEQEVINKWNHIQRKLGDKGTLVKTINEAYGGYQRGQDEAFKLIYAYLWDLKKIGISYFLILHTKKKSMSDPMNETEYEILTSAITSRYFDMFKTKLHFLGFAFIDRAIKQTRTNKKINGKEILKGSVTSEKRVISFREEDYSVDSKSRFEDIVERIPLDAMAYKEAIENAIETSIKKRRNEAIEDIEKEQNKQSQIKQEQELEKAKEKKEKENEDLQRDELINRYKEFAKELNSSGGTKKLQPIIETAKELGVNLTEITNWDLELLKKFINKIGA